MYNILIFTVTAGNGHNTLASSLKKSLEKYYLEQVNIKIVDFYKNYSSNFKGFIVDNCYRASVKYALPLYNYTFKSMQNKMDNTKYSFTTSFMLAGKEKKVLETINEFKPDCIICTHFFPAILLCRLKEKCNLNIPIVGMITDYVVSPYMEYLTNVTKLFVPVSDFNERLLEIGYKREQLVELGYLSKIDVENNIREKSKRLTILIFSGAGAFDGLKKEIKELFNEDLDINIILINGKDAKSKNQFDKYITKLKLRNKLTKTNIENYGFISNEEMLNLLKRADCVVSKAGANSLTETINLGKVLITTSKLAEQEWQNVKYLQKYAQCFLIDKKNTLTNLIKSNIFTDEFFEKYAQDIKQVQVPEANKNYADAVINICKEFKTN